MADIAVTNPQVVVNNVAVPVIPNSVTYTEGFGEQNQRVQSAGGGNTELVFSDDVETKISMVKFSMLNTQANIDLIRSWKANRNANAITITGDPRDGGDALKRTFANGALTTDYEVNLGADTEIEVEFMTDPAV